jgi:hypothetical protein
VNIREKVNSAEKAKDVVRQKGKEGKGKEARVL